MAQNDVLKRYIDAGLAFTVLTQGRAEGLVKDLVKAGEVQADQAREAVADLLERSRKNSERLIETVRTEVRTQITNLGLVSQADLDRIEQRLASLLGTATSPAKRATTTAKRAPTRKAPAKRAAAKKAPAKRAATKKAPVKRAATKKAPVKRAATKKAPVKRAATKKAGTAKRAAAKKASAAKKSVKKA